MTYYYITKKTQTKVLLRNFKPSWFQFTANFYFSSLKFLFFGNTSEVRRGLLHFHFYCYTMYDSFLFSSNINVVGCLIPAWILYRCCLTTATHTYIFLNVKSKWGRKNEDRTGKDRTNQMVFYHSEYFGKKWENAGVISLQCILYKTNKLNAYIYSFCFPFAFFLYLTKDASSDDDRGIVK